MESYAEHGDQWPPTMQQPIEATGALNALFDKERLLSAHDCTGYHITPHRDFHVGQLDKALADDSTAS